MPWQRVGFRHPNLKQWVHDHRGELLAALLTVARAWFVAGPPSSPTAPPLGSFESWATIVGGILGHAGISGFLGNLDCLYQESDPSQLQWEAFLLALSGVFSRDNFTIKERKGSLQRRLGRSFSERVGRRYGSAGVHLLKAGSNRNKVALWRVRGRDRRDG
jgi:hypothetical protein